MLAVGAHTVNTRDFHEDLLRGAQVIVEEIEATQCKAGDIVQAIGTKAITGA